jgi:heme exporter protein D
MIWASWSDFFAMGGYALYVWGSVIVMFACLGVEVAALRWRTASVRRQHRMTRRMDRNKQRKEVK